MKEQFRVAQNAFSVSADDSIRSWERLRRRFSPFCFSEPANPVLDIDIKTGPLPENAGQIVYEPEYNGIGLITARAMRMPDSGIALEFQRVTDRKPCVLMKMPPALDKAYIITGCDGETDDVYFLSHAIMIAFMLASARTGTLLIHASTVVCGGKAYLFQGKSGTGKSTHAALWIQNIPGAELLNDDHPAVRFNADGTAMAYGTPWSGKTHCYRNAAAPVGAFVRIVRAKENALRRLAPLSAYGSLTASVFFLPFVSEELLSIRHKQIERLAQTAECCEMHCLPDADAAFVCRKGLSDE